jgi:hypothetical protein
MAPLASATTEFSTLLSRAATELPRFTDTELKVAGHWSKKEILGHLIDSAADNHQRFVRGQLASELADPGYAQNEWVATERCQEREWSELVELWVAYNRHLLHLMSRVAPDRLATSVRIKNDDPVTLEFVMIDYVSHVKHHLVQLGLTIE